MVKEDLFEQVTRGRENQFTGPERKTTDLGVSYFRERWQTGSKQFQPRVEMGLIRFWDTEREKGRVKDRSRGMDKFYLFSGKGRRSERKG